MSETSIATPSSIAWLGFALGALFGAVGNRTNFCTLGAVADIVAMGDWNRMRMWLLAIAVAILGSQALQYTGIVDLSKSIYTASRLKWLSSIAGGMAFGIGMALASGCGSKTLIRIGGGNLKSLVVFAFMAISAYMTLRGLFALWRVELLDARAIALPTQQDLPSLLTITGAVARPQAILLGALAVGGILAAFALAARDFRRFDNLLGGIVVGLVVAGGWYVTGHLGYIAEHPETLQEAFVGTNSGRAESLTFVAPFAYTLELLMFWSDASKSVTFGIAAVLGVVAGSGAWAIGSGSFRLESFRDPADMLRHIAGGILMGFGGVTALGCTIGQGISGMSTLALGSMLTLAAIIAGCFIALKLELWLAMGDQN
ncbi:MAG: YeeE/YedE family protein [Candidatus Methylophosphatis roskildensis]